MEATLRERLATSDIDPAHRMDFWRTTLSEMFAPVAIEDCEAANFGSEIESIMVDKIMLSQFDGVGQTVNRPKSLIKSGQNDDYVAIIQIGGGARYTQGDTRGVAEHGSITLHDLAHPTSLICDDRIEILDVSVPRADFERMLGPATKAAGLKIGADQSSAPLIGAFFQSLMAHGDLLDPSTAARMATIGIDMLAAGFAETLALEPRAGIRSATIAYRAKVYIEEHLSNFDLGVPKIAAALNISTRRLHDIFAEQDLTVDGYVWERRLVAAWSRLRDQAYAPLSIAEVGYSVGFISQAHFSRRFRVRFAMTASDCREQARLEHETKRLQLAAGAPGGATKAS